MAWQWKSAMGLEVATINWTARVSIARWNLKEAVGKAPAWGIRTTYKAIQFGWVCLSKQNPILTKDCVVDVAGICGEGYCSYPGRSDLKWLEVSRGHISWLMPVRGWTWSEGLTWRVRETYQEGRKLYQKSTLKGKRCSCRLIRESRIHIRHKPKINSAEKSVVLCELPYIERYVRRWVRGR